MTIEQQVVAKISEAMANLTDKESIKEGIEKLSGLPNKFVPLLASLLAAKNDISASELSDKIAPFVFDLVLTAVAIGYAEGKRQGADATLNAKSASESVS